jgi:hypothetical protein
LLDLRKKASLIYCWFMMESVTRNIFLILKIPSLILVLGLGSYLVNAQEQFGDNVNSTKNNKHNENAVPQKLDLGLGVGLDYGGIAGVNLCYTPFKYIGLYASGGYYRVSFGWQTGIAGYVKPKTDQSFFIPFIKASYGTNRFIMVKEAKQYNQAYLGFSASAGIEIRFGWFHRHGLNLEINYAINSSGYKRDIDFIKHNTSYALTTIPALTISFGYHFVIL